MVLYRRKSLPLRPQIPQFPSTEVLSVTSYLCILGDNSTHIQAHFQSFYISGIISGVVQLVFYIWQCVLVIFLFFFSGCIVVHWMNIQQFKSSPLLVDIWFVSFLLLLQTMPQWPSLLVFLGCRNKVPQTGASFLCVFTFIFFFISLSKFPSSYKDTLD